jgi:spermidine/putrescine transport system permease protein
VFAIIFLVAPLILVIFYSFTRQIDNYSVYKNFENSPEIIIDNLDFIGYDEDSSLSRIGTYYYDGEKLTIVNYRPKHPETYRVFFEDGKISNIEEYDGEELIAQDLDNVKFLNKLTGFYFTIDNFVRFFNNGDSMKVFLRSIYIAFMSTVFCLLIGFPTAYVLSKMKERTRNIVSVMFLLPMWINFLLRTYAWRTLVEKTGIINTILGSVGLPAQNLMYTQGAVILVMVYDFLPFMILPIYNTLIKIDRSLIEASYDLGANHYRTLFRVIFPLAIPGISSGITMTFVPAITAFAISKIMGGTQCATIGEEIERVFNNDMWFGSAMSVIIMVLMLASMFLISGKDSDSDNIGGGLI